MTDTGERMTSENALRNWVGNSTGEKISENGTMKLSAEHLSNDYPIPELLMSEIKVCSMCLGV